MEQEDKLQCILIAAEYTKLLFPHSVPLLNVVNVPMIEYVLETLNRNGFDEVIIFCEKSGDQLKTLVTQGIDQNKSWSINMSIQTILLKECIHLNQALADLYSRGLVRGNFVLLEANTIANVNFRNLMELHVKNCKADKDAVMTVAYKRIPEYQKGEDEVVLVSEKATNRLLFYKKLGKTNSKKLQFPLEVFKNFSQTVVHHDLQDPQIAVCSSAALNLFVDNYDYTSLEIFIQGVLENEELLGSRIYMTELGATQYARKISNWQAYQFISQDILNRWVYPLVPNNGVSLLKQQLSFYRNMIYKSDSAHLKRSVETKHNVVIDENSCVSCLSSLSNTVVGKNCKVGERCQLDSVYVLDGATIGSDVIASNVVIGRNSVVGDKSRLDQGTVVGDDCQIPPGSQLSSAIVVSNPVETEWDLVFNKIGEAAYCVGFVDTDNDSIPADDEDEENDDKYQLTLINALKMGQLERNCPSSAYTSTNNGYSTDSTDENSEDDAATFKTEIFESMKRAYEINMELQNLLVELNGSRFAHNVSLSDVNFHVIQAILMMPVLKLADKNIMVEFGKLLKYFRPAVKNYIKGHSEMADCLRAIESVFEEDARILQKAGDIVHYLYDKEIVSEEAVLEWFEKLDPKWHSPSLKKLVEWLEQSSEEESD